MKLEKITNSGRYQAIVAQYGQKGCVSNDYLQREAEKLIAGGKLYEICLERNAYLFVEKDTCYRMYYYLNDMDESVVLPDGAYVVEILYRGYSNYPEGEVSYLSKMGFDVNLVRDQYSGMYKDLHVGETKTDAIVMLAKSIEEVSEACELFNSSFDSYSGDYIAPSEYQKLFDGGNILVAKDVDGAFLGALHQTVENRVAWLSHVAVVAAARGRHVGKTLVQAYVESNHQDDKSRYMLWVQHQNTVAVNLYQQIGLKYINKSTLSLIKK